MCTAPVTLTVHTRATRAQEALCTPGLLHNRCSTRCCLRPRGLVSHSPLTWTDAWLARWSMRSAVTQTLLGRHRARCRTVRLPMPPVRPVRETFASYGSRQRDITRKVHFTNSTVHSPWTALRVRWVPLYCFPTLSLRPFALYVAFLRSDYYGLFDCLQGLGDFGAGLPCLLPLSFPSLPGSPVFTMEDSHKML